MKRILALVVSLFLVLSLSSALAEEKVTIEFFCVKEEVQSIFQEIINDFEAENPDIHVELTYASDGETVLLTRIASNEVPDTMSLYPAEMTYRQLLDEGYIMDLTDCGFESNVEQSMLDLMYQIPSDESIESCVMTKDVIDGSGEPVLMYSDDGKLPSVKTKKSK